MIYDVFRVEQYCFHDNFRRSILVLVTFNPSVGYKLTKYNTIKIQNSDGCAPGHKFMASPEKNETISYFGNERRVDGLLAASSAYLISIGLNSSFMSRNGNGPSPDQG